MCVFVKIYDDFLLPLPWSNKWKREWKKGFPLTAQFQAGVLGKYLKCMKMYQLKYLFCFVKLSPSSPFMLNQAQNSKYNTTKEFKIMAELTHNTN